MKVQTAVQKAVREWEEAGGQWPDDWARWQRAIDDAYGYPYGPQLDEL